jgi:hypothetical protein
MSGRHALLIIADAMCSTVILHEFAFSFTYIWDKLRWKKLQENLVCLDITSYLALLKVVVACF